MSVEFEGTAEQSSGSAQQTGEHFGRRKSRLGKGIKCREVTTEKVFQLRGDRTPGLALSGPLASKGSHCLGSQLCEGAPPAAAIR